MKSPGLILDISRTHLLSRKKQSIIAALGVTFGIGTFITLMSFMTGLNKLLDGLILNRSPHIHIHRDIQKSETQAADLILQNPGSALIHSIKPKDEPQKVPNARALINYLESKDEVRGISPQVQVQLFYLSGSNTINGVSNGIEVVNEMELFVFSDYIIKGEPIDLQRVNNSIILGAELAEDLSATVGDNIQVSTADGEIFRLKVIGIYQSGLADIDKIQSYVDIRTAQKLIGENTGYYTDLFIKLYDIEQAPSLAQYLENQFQITATDIQTANAQFETGTSIRNMITYAVSFTLLLVAGFGIYNILNMLIYEKMNDIAILKATGFTGSDVSKIFITQALIIGFIGGILGLLVGAGLSLLIDQAPFETDALPTIKTFPVNHNPYYYIGGMIFAIIATFLAGYLPSQRAKGIDPVEIIRGQ
jgi:lipoprotein-releasing system permease protein